MHGLAHELLETLVVGLAIVRETLEAHPRTSGRRTSNAAATAAPR